MAGNTGSSIAIVSAGTSDLPVVEDAYETALFLGNKAEKMDVLYEKTLEVVRLHDNDFEIKKLEMEI
jgi:NCAIR mutase (PurE)-related proteins